MRKGYTTGTCAAIAGKAAARMIFEQEKVKREFIVTPSGTRVEVDISDADFEKNKAKCAVKKDAGDDPDCTDGIMIYAEVCLKKEKEINIDGGVGIGRVTKKGLWQKIGQAAINKVPMMMIKSAVGQIFDEYGYGFGADIIISAPEGEEIAKKTFNPRLGIRGGISILGTSGIVEPMSSQALIDTIRAELKVKRANEGEYVMIAPGNYGVEFIRENFSVELDNAVKCSNFIGEAIDFAAEEKFGGMILIGHIGKFVKLAGGIMNTHSRNADSRMEIIAANTAMVCDDVTVIRKIMECLTTDEAIEILKEKNICDSVMKRITERALFYVRNRAGDEIRTEMIIFSNKFGMLGKSDGAENFMENMRTKK